MSQKPPHITASSDTIPMKVGSAAHGGSRKTNAAAAPARASRRVRPRRCASTSHSSAALPPP